MVRLAQHLIVGLGCCFMLAPAGPAARPAAAAVTFGFEQTGSTPAGAVSVSAGLSLSDAAFASGLSVSTDWLSPQVDWAAIGILDILVRVRSPGPPVLNVALRDLTPSPLSSQPVRWSFRLSAAPYRTPSLSFSFNDTWDQIGLRADATSGAGFFNTEGGGPCTRTGACSFTGFLAPVAVPEPSSALLLGGAVLSFGWLRRQAGRSARA